MDAVVSVTPPQAVAAPAAAPSSPSSADIKLVYQLAQIGLSRMPAGSRVAPKMAAAYKRVREYLLQAGELPR